MFIARGKPGKNNIFRPSWEALVYLKINLRIVFYTNNIACDNNIGNFGQIDAHHHLFWSPKGIKHMLSQVSSMKQHLRGFYEWFTITQVK